MLDRNPIVNCHAVLMVYKGMFIQFFFVLILVGLLRQLRTVTLHTMPVFTNQAEGGQCSDTMGRDTQTCSSGI